MEGTMELISDRVKISWEDIGEGLCGEYNPSDEKDVALYRFYVEEFKDGEWQEVEDASYCTQVPVSTPDETLRGLLEVLMDHFYVPVMDGQSVKKLGERMSWVDPSWVERGSR
jgi:hypothetical protein